MGQVGPAEGHRPQVLEDPDQLRVPRTGLVNVASDSNSGILAIKEEMLLRDESGCNEVYRCSIALPFIFTP